MKKAKYSLILVTHWPSGTIQAARYGRVSGQNPDTLLHGTGMGEGMGINESAIFKRSACNHVIMPSFCFTQIDVNLNQNVLLRCIQWAGCGCVC